LDTAGLLAHGSSPTHLAFPVNLTSGAHRCGGLAAYSCGVSSGLAARDGAPDSLLPTD